jgi:hypothetical protein
MKRTSPRVARRPKAARSAQSRATLVFRDFVRQLEKLATRPVKSIREAPIREATIREATMREALR